MPMLTYGFVLSLPIPNRNFLILVEGREGEDADNADNDEEETDKPVKKKVFCGANSRR